MLQEYMPDKRSLITFTCKAEYSSLLIFFYKHLSFVRVKKYFTRYFRLLNTLIQKNLEITGM